MDHRFRSRGRAAGLSPARAEIEVIDAALKRERQKRGRWIAALGEVDYDAAAEIRREIGSASERITGMDARRASLTREVERAGHRVDGGRDPVGADPRDRVGVGQRFGGQDFLTA